MSLAADSTRSFSGWIVRQYMRERMLELELDGGDPGASRGRPGRAEPTVFVYVAGCARVIDEAGVELAPREGASTWFAEDRGWRLVAIGRRIAVEHAGSRELSAPRPFRDEARPGRTVVAFDAETIRMIGPSRPPLRSK